MRPIAHPIAQPSATENAWTGPGSTGNSTAKDSPRSSYITRGRLDLLAPALTDLDWRLIGFVSDYRLVTGGQLIRAFWKTTQRETAAARAGRRTLKRLRESRVLDALPRAIGGVRGGSDGLVYGVGIAGRKLLARRGLERRRLGTPGDRYVQHSLSVTEVVVRLHEARQAGRVDLIEVNGEPACWRGFLGPLGERVVLKPDLALRLGAGAYEDIYLLEVDLATEASGTLTGKGRRYLAHYRSGSEQAAHGVYPRIIWTVPDARRGEQVHDALRHLPSPAPKLFSVWLFEEVVERLAAEAQV